MSARMRNLLVSRQGLRKRGCRATLRRPAGPSHLSRTLVGPGPGRQGLSLGRSGDRPQHPGRTGGSRNPMITRELSMDTKLEVVVLPVSDVDKAKAFYRALGWREDGDFSSGDRFRIVQMTPPGSPTSVLFGKGVTDAAPGSVQDLVLAVDDIDAARAELVAQGAEVGDVWHDADGVFYHGGGRNRVPGADPKRRTYSSFATFSDPDGNGFVLQEVTTRLPGRLWSDFGADVAALADLLRD